MKKICIDARFWGIGHTGIGRYVENLIANLPVDNQVEIVLIVHPDQDHEPSLQRYARYVARLHPYSVWSQIEMALLLWEIRPDLLHVPHFTIPVLWFGKTVVTIHDLIKHLSTGPLTTTRTTPVYWFKHLGYLLLVRLAVTRAKKIIVPAKYWKNILVDKFSLDQQKIVVTYEGVGNRFLDVEEDRTYKVPLDKPFLVYTGNLYPHKNVPVLISACQKLKINLAIVCARNVFSSRLPKSKYVHFLGRLTDQQLVRLYQQAEAFVFPSLIEGFGLPGLEAMAVKLPVIAADASCLPEIYGAAAIYFDPYSVDELANKITQLLADKNLKDKQVDLGLKQVAKYSWAKMATQTWEIYQTELP